MVEQFLSNYQMNMGNEIRQMLQMIDCVHSFISGEQETSACCIFRHQTGTVISVLPSCKKRVIVR